jgi:Acyl CoA:acetate/3-ketoacid CoA transferase, beta subunit
MDWRNIIAKNIALMLKDGDFVNLGVGVPMLVGNYIPDDITVILEGENGSAGLGRQLPFEGIYDDAETFERWENEHRGDQGDYRTGHKDMANAGSNVSTLIEGACTFDVPTSFGILRGGHLDMTVLGALQVDEYANLANWVIPGRRVNGMGGSMDILAGTKNVTIAMQHEAKDGSAKILRECTLPLTAVHCVTRVVTEKCIMEFIEGGEAAAHDRNGTKRGHYRVTAMYPGVSEEEVQSACEAELEFVSRSEMKSMAE